jgi:6-phosphogluconolactonase (cycloisomerase 2 family)
MAAYRLSDQGSLTPVGSLITTPQYGPCALAVTPDNRAIYVGDFQHFVYSYLISASDGSLTYVGERASSSDHAPYASLICDSAGQNLYAAEQSSSGGGGGLVTQYQIRSTDGTITAGPTSLAMSGDPGGIALRSGHLYVPGYDNKVRIYDIGTGGALTENAASPYALGSGFYPSSAAIHPTQGYLYIADSSHSQVLTLTIKADGTLGTPVITADGDGRQPLGMVSDPLGRFVFTSNYFSSTISSYRVGTSGSLTFAGSRACNAPQGLVVDPTGKFLLAASKGQYNMGPGHTISVFSIDTTSGLLTLQGTADLGAGNEPNYLAVARFQ